MTTVIAGSSLVLHTNDGSTHVLLSLAAEVVDGAHSFDVLVPADLAGVERGTVEMPTTDGPIWLPAWLDADLGRLHVTLPYSARPKERRLAPRAGLIVPLRGAARLRRPDAGPTDPGTKVWFDGHTVDVGPGGLQARVISRDGLRLPQYMRDVVVELDPDDQHQSVAAVLHVVSLRSDVLRAKFSFVSLTDWTRLQDRARHLG
jgi:hypothetical protein